MKRYELVANPLTNNYISDLQDWLGTYPKLTKGDLTWELEKEFASYIGTKYSVFVNSGSSANLLALWAAKEESSSLLHVGVPALSWATDLAPVMQLGLIPTLIDCNFNDLSLDMDFLESVIVNLDALMLVSVLGIPPNMDAIMRLCKKHNVLVIEDCCESLGSRFDGKLLGSFGDMSTFSTYFGHHISTIEGGFVCTDSRSLYDLLLAGRSHGWARDLAADSALLKGREITPFTFLVPGFNLRNTEIGAFLGLKQLEDFRKGLNASRREDNYLQYNQIIATSLLNLPSKKGNVVSNFAYPVVFEETTTMEAIDFLAGHGIESRPLIAGSLELQPMWEDYVSLDDSYEPQCVMAAIVHEYGIYIPNTPRMVKNDVSYIASAVNLLK